MLVALFPVFATSSVYHLYVAGQHTSHWRPEEVLFFSLMISSIALGELVELFFRDYKNFNNFRLFLLSHFFVCLFLSVFFYGVSVTYEVMNGGRVDEPERILLPSAILAAFIVIPGTVLEYICDKMDRTPDNKQADWKQ